MKPKDRAKLVIRTWENFKPEGWQLIPGTNMAELLFVEWIADQIRAAVEEERQRCFKLKRNQRKERRVEKMDKEELKAILEEHREILLARLHATYENKIKQLEDDNDRLSQIYDLASEEPTLEDEE